VPLAKNNIIHHDVYGKERKKVKTIESEIKQGHLTQHTAKKKEAAE
jgi:hypothetical protein